MPGLDTLFDLLQLAIKERTQLALENVALPRQLAVYQRSVKRPNINDGDRILPAAISPGHEREVPLMNGLAARLSFRTGRGTCESCPTFMWR